MAGTETPDRPDVEGMKARAEADWRKRGMTPPVQEALALIAHIEALEACQEKLEAARDVLTVMQGGLANAAVSYFKRDKFTVAGMLDGFADMAAGALAALDGGGDG